MTKYKTKVVKNRKAGKPLLLLLTADEHEYLERIIKDRGGKMAYYIREKVFVRGWRRQLEEFIAEQGPLAKKPAIS